MCVGEIVPRHPRDSPHGTAQQEKIPQHCDILQLGYKASAAPQAAISNTHQQSAQTIDLIETTTTQNNVTNTTTMPTEIQTPLHFRTLLNAHTYLIADFYATWCPPCKQIAPIYNQLSTQHTAAGKFAFVKVNVDEQRELAGQYGVTAMPTFLLFKDGKKVDEIRGADVRRLKSAIEGAESEVKRAVEEERKKAAVPKEEKVVEEEEKKVDGEEKTVSGSYGMSSNANWKMSLR